MWVLNIQMEWRDNPTGRFLLGRIIPWFNQGTWQQNSVLPLSRPQHRGEGSDGWEVGFGWGKNGGKNVFLEVEMIWGYFTQLISGPITPLITGPGGAPPCINDSHLSRCMTLGLIFLGVDKFNTKMLGEFSCFFSRVFGETLEL